MGFPSIARAVARAVSSPTLFGEEITYRRAVGGNLQVNAIVDRRPPSIETMGSTSTTIVEGTVLVRREDLAAVTTGRDEVVIVWTDGATRTARVVEVIDVSDGLWRLGIKL